MFFYKRFPNSFDRKASAGRLTSFLAWSAVITLAGLTCTGELNAAPAFSYETGFTGSEGYISGALDGQNGWTVISGVADVVDFPLASGGRAAALRPSDPLSVLSREFTELSPESPVFVSFYISGALGDNPETGPGIYSPGAFAVAFVREDDRARMYAFDGDSAGGGDWRSTAVEFSLEEGEALPWSLVTVRADYLRNTFDLYIGETLAGFDYRFSSDDTPGFASLRFRGNQCGSVYIDELYVGQSNPLFQNLSGDGIPDEWKIRYGLDIGRDVRDEDPDGDGLSNLDEFFLGSDPLAFDTSKDGLSDSDAVALDVSWLTPSNLFPADLPFFDDFEGWPVGSINGRGGWIVGGDGAAEVIPESRAGGEQTLLLDGRHAPVSVKIGISENDESIVWTDFYVDPAIHTRNEPPELSLETAVGLYFDSAGKAVAWDGLTGAWRAFAPIMEGEQIDWIRVTIQQNFADQTWSLWLNSVRVAEGLGFASQRDSYTWFSVAESSEMSLLDNVFIAAHEPAALDNDGDGLTNEEERLLGTDPDAPDTSGDGMWDREKVLWGFNPLEQGNFARWTKDQGGRRAWNTGFEPEEGFETGPLHGQQGWIATVGAEVSAEMAHAGQQGVKIFAANPGEQTHRIERFFGFENEKRVWVTAHVISHPGELPDPNTIEGPRSALIAFDTARRINVFDGKENRWVRASPGFDREEWVRLDILLDYNSSEWWLCVNGVLVLRDLGFRDPNLRTLTRMAIRGGSGARAEFTSVDTLSADLGEPANLDFSGDGLTNDQKRALGLDIFATDTTGDGIPDWWLVQYGLDAGDATLGNQTIIDNGLTVLQSYLLGSDPAQWDTDGDGWSDFQEYLAGTDLHDPASAPVADGMQEWVVARVGQGLEPYSFRVGDEYLLLGSGVGIGPNEDGFTFVYQEISGNFEAIACIPGPEHLALGPEGRPEWMAINGLMARATLESDSPYSAVSSATYLMHGPAESYWSHFREIQGGRSVPLAHGPSDSPKYVRMRRVNNRFRHYLSHDGEAWALVAEVAVQMPEAILLGMFTASDSTDSYVRGRVWDVGISGLYDESDWKWSDTDGGVHFDSFAWMGEWSDGVEEFDSAALVLRQPALEELHEAGFEIATAVVIDGADAVDTLGEWEVHDKSIVCMDRRGWVEFDLEVAGQDVFLLELEAREHNSNRFSLATFDLKFYIGEEYLGTRTLEATYKDSGTVYVFTPWLQQGTHRLRVLWDGARQWSYLSINAVRLLTLDQAGPQEGGVKKWVEDRISRQSGMHPQPPLLTHVSPIQVEGHDRFNTMMRLGNEALLQGGPGMHRQFFRPFADHPRGAVGRDYQAFREYLSQGESSASVPGETHSIPNHPVQRRNYLNRWAAPAAVEVRRGAGYRFWADVPLAPLVDNALTLQWQDGVAEERRVVRWIPFNVLTGGSMVLRTGDSIMLTAHAGNQQSGQVLISINNELFETIPASPIVHTFSEPGEYLIEGVYQKPNGQTYSGALQVSVDGFSFVNRPLGWVGRSRAWRGEHASRDTVSFDGDPRLGLTVTDDLALRFNSHHNDSKIIAARVSEKGAILDTVQVDGLRVFSGEATNSRIVDILPDGTRVVEMMTILSPVYEDARIRFRIFVGGVLFDDGEIERVLTAEDFDELGQASVRFLMEKDVRSSACHRMYVYQNETLL